MGRPRRTTSPCGRSGSGPQFDFEPLDHLELGQRHGWIEMEAAAETSGSRFAYLIGDLVMLELALIRFAVELVRAEGFEPTVPPVLVRERALFGTGIFPAEREMIYEVPKDELFLVGTSEVSLASLHADQIMEAAELPKRYAGISTCFRREAGAAGRDTRGIFRVHQFDKVEMFSFVEPSASGRGARADPRDPGAHPHRPRDPLPGGRHRGGGPRRSRRPKVRLRGLDSEPEPLSGGDKLLRTLPTIRQDACPAGTVLRKENPRNLCTL